MAFSPLFDRCLVSYSHRNNLVSYFRNRILTLALVLQSMCWSHHFFFFRYLANISDTYSPTKRDLSCSPYFSAELIFFFKFSDSGSIPHNALRAHGNNSPKLNSPSKPETNNAAAPDRNIEKVRSPVPLTTECPTNPAVTVGIIFFIKACDFPLW